MMQKTLVLLKPDAIKRGVVGEIIQRFERAGLKLIGIKQVWVDKDFAGKHYSEHVKKDFYKTLEDFITSGPVIALCLEGVNSVEVVRKMVGSTEPSKSLPGTIRGDYAHISNEWVNKNNKPMTNLIHASDSGDNAKKEIALWFKEEELHSYKTAYEDLVF